MIPSCPMKYPIILIINPKVVIAKIAKTMFGLILDIRLIIEAPH